MKFSKGLLSVNEVGDRIFNGSIDKAKKLLSSIFGMDFKSGGAGIKDFSINYGTNVFITVFEYLERTITAKLSYIPVENDIIQDILEISEESITVFTQNSISDDFITSVNKAMDILEEKFNLCLTPLDPDEKDKNIKDIINQEPESFTVKFTQEDYEGEYTASVIISNGSYNFNVVRDTKHVIFLD